MRDVAHHCVGIQTVWECILPINIPRTFLASLCDLFCFSSRFCLLLPRSDHFRVRLRAALQVRAACVRARSLAILRVGMATDVT